MSEATCLHCGDTMPAIGPNGSPPKYCSLRCSNKHRAAADAQTEYDRLQELAERALSRAGGVTTCKAWIPTDSGSRYCGEPATRRMLTRWDGMVSVCRECYEQWRDTTP